jgi:universal stress protein E
MFAIANPEVVTSAVLDKVVRLTSALGAELDLFHSADGSFVSQPERLGPIELEQEVGKSIEGRRQQLEHLAQSLQRPGMPVHANVHWGYPPYEGIIQQVLRDRPDLLITQASRHHGPWRLAYTDYKLIETCPCPLLLIKTTRPYVNCRLIAAVDPMHEHDKPAALDDVILDVGTAFSKALSGKLWLFHARIPWARITLGQQPADAGEAAEIIYSRGVEERVLELARRHGIAHNDIELVEGYAAIALPFFARRESADIVALGAVSRSLLKRIVIGHTAETLLDGLDCDMLIVKPPGFRSRAHPQAESPA